MKYIILTALLLAGSAASTQEASAQAAGEYQLTEVAGAPLPAVVERDNGCREEVESATLTLEENGFWRIHGSGRRICGEKITPRSKADAGRWSMEGTNLRFVEADDDNGDDDDDHDLDDIHTGTLSGNTLRVRIGESERFLVFQRK